MASHEKIKALFPRASKATIDLNPDPSPPELEIRRRTRNWHPWTEKDDRLLLELSVAGLTHAMIGAQIGRSKASVSCRSHHLEITNDRTETPRKLARRSGMTCVIACAYCEKRFEILEADHRRNQRKYCSKKCFARDLTRKPSRARSETIPCPQCKKDFKRGATPSARKQRFCSQKCAQTNPDVARKRITTTRNNPNATKTAYAWCKRGWRQIGDQKIYARSKWEANYARYLEFLRKRGELKKWEHEPETFWFEKIKRGCRSYLPDFRLTNRDGSIEYHEVKGWMDARSITKAKRMKKYYPKIKIILIAGDWFKANNLKLSGFITGWEK